MTGVDILPLRLGVTGVDILPLFRVDEVSQSSYLTLTLTLSRSHFPWTYPYLPCKRLTGGRREGDIPDRLGGRGWTITISRQANRGVGLPSKDLLVPETDCGKV